MSGNGGIGGLKPTLQPTLQSTLHLTPQLMYPPYSCFPTYVFTLRNVLFTILQLA